MSSKHEPILQQIHNLYQGGNHTEAMRLLDRVLSACARERQTDSMVMILTALTEVYPYDRALLARAAALYDRVGRVEEALAIYNGLVELHLQAGEYQAAAQIIRWIIRLKNRI